MIDLIHGPISGLLRTLERMLGILSYHVIKTTLA